MDLTLIVLVTPCTVVVIRGRGSGETALFIYRKCFLKLYLNNLTKLSLILPESLNKIPSSDKFPLHKLLQPSDEPRIFSMDGDGCCNFYYFYFWQIFQFLVGF